MFPYNGIITNYERAINCQTNEFESVTINYTY